MTYETLDLRREGAVAWLTLNRPEALNAMNRKLVGELRESRRSSASVGRSTRTRSVRYISATASVSARRSVSAAPAFTHSWSSGSAHTALM